MVKTLQIRLPGQLRDDAATVLEEMGLDLPTAVRLYLTKVVQTRSIPFPLEAGGIRVEPVEVDAETQARMDGIAVNWSKRRAKERSA